jgi:SP family general alpha glucoside:H+ symporter-like MFS transporter
MYTHQSNGPRLTTNLPFRGPLTYCYTAEIGSARMRSKVIAWGNMCNQFYGLIINIVNPYMINPDEANMEGKVGWVYGGLGLISSVICWLTVPETGNRTVDE